MQNIHNLIAHLVSLNKRLFSNTPAILQFPICLLMLAILSACTSCSVDSINLLPQQQFSDATEVLVQVRSGHITVTQSNSGQVELTGNAPQNTIIQQTGGQITIESETSAVDLQIVLPPGMKLGIDSFDADVEISNFEGIARVNGEAGDITVSSFEGEGLFRSGRGDILVTNSQGEITLLGEHGLLDFTQVLGTLSATTIMGTARFSGVPGAGDIIWLETDHGPVEINLQPGSNLTLETNTASGKVYCMASSLFNDSQTCNGQAGLGEAQLGIRTVSGNITIRAIP